MTSTSTIPTGCGDGTSLRQPRLSMCDHVSPLSRVRCSATSRGRKGPTGFVGTAKALSSASTRTWVMTLTTRRDRPRALSSFLSACWIM